MRSSQETPEATTLPYKFKELKVYNSTEYLWENVKKYRQVFDRFETAYVYTELSLVNKNFDLEDWSLRVDLKCYSVDGKDKTEVCSLSLEKEVSKFDHLVFLREGWGNQKRGTFWKRGTYFWEAFIDGKKVGSKYFYVIEPFDNVPDPLDDDWDVKESVEKYLELQQARLYEGPYDDVSEDDRVFLKAFSVKETRYVYLELTFRNLQPETDWHLELFTKYHNQARELKGQVVRLQQVKKHQETIKITAGWGAANPNLWRENSYTADIVFLDRLIASIPFIVDDEAVIGFPTVYLPGKENGQLLPSPEEETDESFDQIMAHLDALTGLHEVKRQIREHAVYIRFLQLRQQRGFEMDKGMDVHSVFIGNPGTGKTTVARMMGKLYRKMGLLTSGHTVIADRVDLVGEYIGQTAPKTREVIDQARGGVLFIDEAYALARSNDDGKDFGREVIEILVKEMSNGEGDLAVIVAGYPDEMKRFLDSNTGLKSRFKHNYDFRDFMPQELSTIADYAATELGVSLTLQAKARIDEIITKAFRSRDRSFGNARYVHNLIEKAKVQMALRLMGNEQKLSGGYSDAQLSLIELGDVNLIEGLRKKEKPAIPVNDEMLSEALTELDGLIGMENIKSQLHDLVSLVRYYRQIGRDVLNSFHLHTVLIGNPGTGKTTVARILAKLYNALGILERGHIVETDRQGMVAGYVGQTAEKTAKKVEEAIGGVLFIDEAYALTQKSSQRGDFGDEAIQALLKRMEDRRGEFFVCVAGYPDNMDTFLKANPGLSSRFDKTLRFEDYEPEQLMEIARSMFAERKAKLSPAAATHLEDYLTFLHKYRDSFFGNARSVRKIASDIIRRHDLRRSVETGKKPGKEKAIRILKSDVEHLKLDTKELSIQRKRIGF
jgi:SpoVK/Ycf46/Vps4 family AAA+-type ATPase